MDVENFIQENMLLGRLCEGAKPTKFSGQHAMLKGSILTHQGEVEAYIKNCKKADIVSTELIVALIGRMYKLPIPKPIIIKLEPNHPDIPVQQTTYLFASEAKNTPDFARFLREAGEKEEIILDHRDTHKIIAFDELIANADRNLGNILYDGSDFQLIDHEYCFDKLQNPKAQISHPLQVGNISDIYKFYRGHNDVMVSKTMHAIKTYIKNEIQTTTEESLKVLSLPSLGKVGYNERIKFIKNFILNRLPVLETLIKASISKNEESTDLLSQGGSYV